MPVPDRLSILILF